jgi:hypothetical protein
LDVDYSPAKLAGVTVEDALMGQLVGLMPRRMPDFGQGRMQTFVYQKPKACAAAAVVTFASGSPGKARRLDGGSKSG